ncbi:hypothetical protein Pla52n_30980 [Stieleria varia]|uniref:Uncharacterized protein n=1 Tax=Stieleria varia TaxID=2528005 RepID=A0A5C6B0X8_9BACT|nr:hypothetical protein Pla52n_30980 [Stieleria varia]
MLIAVAAVRIGTDVKVDTGRAAVQSVPSAVDEVTSPGSEKPVRKTSTGTRDLAHYR